MIKWKRYIIGFCLGAGIAMAVCSNTQASPMVKTANSAVTEPQRSKSVFIGYNCVPEKPKCLTEVKIVNSDGTETWYHYEITDAVNLHIFKGMMKSNGTTSP